MVSFLIDPLPEEGSTLFKMYRCLLGPESWKTDHGVLYYICDYYRSIRNETAHGNEKGTAAKAYERLLNNRDTINRYIGKLKFPSPPDKPGFDDFVLYSKSVKELAQEMCNCIQYDIDRIASRFDIERYKKRRNNLEKCRKSIAHEINMKYGLVGEKLERTVDLIIDKL